VEKSGCYRCRSPRIVQIEPFTPGALGVSRQCVNAWIARYEQGGLAALTDRSSRLCRATMAP
jgi:hypothetical protein